MVPAAVTTRENPTRTVSPTLAGNTVTPAEVLFWNDTPTGIGAPGWKLPVIWPACWFTADVGKSVSPAANAGTTVLATPTPTVVMTTAADTAILNFVNFLSIRNTGFPHFRLVLVVITEVPPAAMMCRPSPLVERGSRSAKLCALVWPGFPRPHQHSSW